MHTGRTATKVQPRRSASRVAASGASGVQSGSPVSAGATSARRGGAKSRSRMHGFWSRLFLVHPWLLVGGLWLVFIALIAIALIGLSSPGRELVLEPNTTGGAPPLSAPDVAASSRLSRRGNQWHHQDPAAIASRNGTPEDMSAWPLLLLVVACAGGCILMSRNSALMMTDPSRRSQRRTMPKAATGRAAARTTLGKSGRQRRKQRRISTHRPTAQVMAFRKGQKIRHTPPQPKPVAAKPVSFSVKSAPPTSVTVVLPQESTPLDWQEGSLAHRLDVRQQRSINSFL